MRGSHIGWSIGLVGFEKLAAFIDTLRQQYAQRVKPVLQRSLISQELFEGPRLHSNPRAPNVNPAAALRVSPEQQQQIREAKVQMPFKDSTKGAIFAKGSLTDNEAFKKFSPPSAKAYSRLAPEHKEMVNRVVGLHEADELDTLGGYGQPTLPLGGHGGPSVIINESNTIAQAPKEVQTVLHHMRQNDQMANHLRSTGKFEYGKPTNLTPEEAVTHAKDMQEYISGLQEHIPEIMSSIGYNHFNEQGQMSTEGFNKFMQHPLIKNNPKAASYFSNMLPRQHENAIAPANRSQRRADKRQHLQSLGTVKSMPGTGPIKQSSFAWYRGFYTSRSA